MAIKGLIVPQLLQNVQYYILGGRVMLLDQVETQHKTHYPYGLSWKQSSGTS